MGEQTDLRLQTGAPRDYAGITRTEVAAAVWSATGSERRGDYDLNPDLRGALPKERRLRPAAVLCPIVERPDGLHVILTRRADHLNSHAGQIAFPGGKVDPADPSPLAAALREAEEEIGLLRGLVDVLGAIDPYETGTGFLVTPFVGFVEPRFTPTPDPSEVAEVFETPLGFLMDPRNHQRRLKRTLQGDRRFYAMPHDGRFIWGATAGMLRNLSDRLHTAAPPTALAG